MTRKLYIKTFGCQMNEYDSSKMADVLKDSHDLQLTDTAEDADVLLLNTCSVRENAQEKVFHQLGRWREWKKARPHLVIGVGGCVASQEGATIFRRAPYVDMVFGPQTLHRLPHLLAAVQRQRTSVIQRAPVMDISFPEIEKFDNLPTPRVNGPTALVSVMEGCSRYCTFCVVPYTRGEEVSRPLEDVLREVTQLARQGVREVTLLGQNVNAYCGAMLDGSDGDGADLALLVTYVAAIEGIDRVRYTTSHPAEFSDSLIDVYASVPQLVSHVHLPVQSGSDRILKLMKRGYTAQDYIDKIRRLRALRPNITISSDFIIGFPGETESDFDATLQLIDTIGFDRSFSFIYSPRPGTPAASLPDDVSLEAKKARLVRVQERINVHATAIAAAMVGTVQRVLVEQRNADDSISGLAENNRAVHFAGDVALIGQFVDVRITEALPSSLRGKWMEAAQPSHHSVVTHAAMERSLTRKEYVS